MRNMNNNNRLTHKDKISYLKHHLTITPYHHLTTLHTIVSPLYYYTIHQWVPISPIRYFFNKLVSPLILIPLYCHHRTDYCTYYHLLTLYQNFTTLHYHTLSPYHHHTTSLPLYHHCTTEIPLYL